MELVQFYEFAPFLDEDIIKGKKLVYVIHSVPTPEPPPPWDPFGGNYDIRIKFEKLCNLASVLVCVSQAEKQKLSKIYPQYEEKIKVVYNGITYDESLDLNDNYKHSRKIFGFIGRTDYRKGIYEPFGYVALEAMQRGLPVICSNNGGLDEILEGYKYKYSPYVEGELERTINEFIEDSVENVEEQQRILIKNMSRFSAINMVKEYEKIWDELINEGR